LNNFYIFVKQLNIKIMKVTVNQLLKESTFTQAEIAKKIGVSENHFCGNIKNNYGWLRLSQFITFAEALEVKPSDLINIWLKENK